MPVPRWFVNISDPSALSLMASIDGSLSVGTLTFFHNDILPRAVMLLQQPNTGGVGLEIVDITGHALDVGIGIPDGATYVASSSFLESTPDAGATAVATAGSATQNAVLAVELGTDSIGGTFQLSLGRPQVYTVAIPANTAIKANGQITCVADVTGSLQSKFFDLPGAASVIVRFWINESAGGTAPATPVGGSLSEITTIVSGDSAVAVATKLTTAVDNHADFTSTAAGGAVITWAAAAYGVKTTVAVDGTAGFGITTVSQGNSGQLDQKSFIIYDEDGSVAVWFDATGAGATGYPASAAAARRQLHTVIAANDTATTVATAAGAVGVGVVDLDSKFTSVSSAGTVTITLVANGAMAAGDATGMSGVTGFSITTSTAGLQSTFLLPWGAQASDLNVAFAGAFTAEDVIKNKWRITAAAKGVYAAPTLVETGLLQSKVFSGTLTIASAGITAAFAAAPTSLTIDAYLEMQYAETTGGEATVLQIPCKIARDYIT